MAEQSTRTVLLALAANTGVGIAKLIAGLVVGSAALLSEAAHSLGDIVSEILLTVALRRSDRPADRSHPFGYGKERFFWSLLAAVSIFTAGALFSIYQGVTTIFAEPEEQHGVLAAYLVIAVSAVLEGASLAQAVRQVRQEKAEDRRGLRDYLRGTDDPTVNTVLFEDSTALVGLTLALAGVGLTQLTGSPVWDGLASLAIGLLLIVVAYGLGRTNLTLLIGRQADIRLVRAVQDRLQEQPEIEAVVDLLTMLTGTERVLVCARLDFVDDVDSAAIERACVRIDDDLRAEFTELDEIFLQPVPRNDLQLRQRVRARYGHTLSPADSPTS